jgi:hypothetical protein
MCRTALDDGRTAPIAASWTRGSCRDLAGAAAAGVALSGPALPAVFTATRRGAQRGRLIAASSRELHNLQRAEPDLMGVISSLCNA